TLSDGAVYTFEADEWKLAAASPLTPRGGATCYAAGGKIIVWGGVEGPHHAGKPSQALVDGATYDCARNTWSSISPYPRDGGDIVGYLWTSRRLLVFESRNDGASSHVGQRSLGQQVSGRRPFRSTDLRPQSHSGVDVRTYDSETDNWE